MAEPFIPDKTIIAPDFRERGRQIMDAIFEADEGSMFSIEIGEASLNGGELFRCLLVSIDDVTQPLSTEEATKFCEFIESTLTDMKSSELISNLGSFIVVIREAVNRANGMIGSPNQTSH